MNFLLLNYTIALLSTALAVFSIGAFVLLKSRKNRINRIFAVFSFSIAWWAFFQGVVNMSGSSSTALILSMIMTAGVFFIPSLFLHFVVSFLNLKKERALLKYAYSLSFIFAALSGTSYMVSGVSSKLFLKYYLDPGIIYHYAVCFFIISAVYGLYKLRDELKKSKDETKRSQLKYLFWPSLIGYAGGGANFLFNYDIYIPILMPFGTYFVGFYVFAVAYAILKYQLMDVKTAVKKAFLYSIGIALVSGGIAGASFLSGWLAGIFPGIKPWMIPFAAGFAAFIAGNLFWKKSKEIERIKYEFITVAAHKLRTPLTKIKWAAIVLNEENVQEEEKRFLVSEILKANNRLIELSDSLLEVSKNEAGKYQYNLDPANLEDIVKKVVSELNAEIGRKNIKLKFTAEENLPAVNIDKKRITSVAQILLENAVDYTRDEITIKISGDKKCVMFSVADNGIGVSKEDQRHIFSRFYRTHEAYLTETEGVGIGLFVAKNIVERHGGKIGVKSDGEGKGSEFWFTLPINYA